MTIPKCIILILNFFYQRYDPKAVGAAKIHQFLSLLGLDEVGTPRATLLLHPSYKKESSVPSTARSERPKPIEEVMEEKETIHLKTARKIKQTTPVIPRLPSIRDCLHYKVR